MGSVRKLGNVFEVTGDDGAVVFVPDDQRNADYQQRIESAIGKGEVIEVLEAPAAESAAVPAFTDDDFEEILTAVMRGGTVARKDIPGAIAKLNDRRAARSLPPV